MTPRITYLGNFIPPWSTENDLRRTMIDMGVEVEALQEEDELGWGRLIIRLISSERPDAVMWTRTASLSAQVPPVMRKRMLVQAYLSDVPTIGVHLDRWWGLTRERDLYQDPFFQVQYLFTADGHDPKRWAALGANHHWLPPAIAPHSAHLGRHDPYFESEISFVGHWQNYGHTEWTHRRLLGEWLSREYAGRVRFWPKANEPAIRGEPLNDLYASTRVVIGDSCLVPDPITGEPWTYYCSDRVFETIGRGGFLVHPYVKGVITEKPDRNLLVSPIHCVGWPLGDWDELKESIDVCLESDNQRALVAKAGFEHVRQYHTYRNRLEDIFDIVGVQW